jgi:hypothetical protein
MLVPSTGFAASSFTVASAFDGSSISFISASFGFSSVAVLLGSTLDFGDYLGLTFASYGDFVFYR